MIQISNERSNENTDEGAQTNNKLSLSPSMALKSTADKTSGFRSSTKRGYRGLSLLSSSKKSPQVDSYLQNCQDCGAIVFGVSFFRLFSKVYF